jgi:hypothetical protein
MRAGWGMQKTIINQAELVAVPILAATMPDVLQNQDVLWFIDNTSAESALVKAGSPTETMCIPALRASATMASLDARVWYEHVASGDNPADILSRDATMDPEVAAKVEAGVWLMRDPSVPVLFGPTEYEDLWQSSHGLQA